MGILRCLARSLRAIDLFPTSTFLRYKGETDYTTATGGCLSITVIIVFVILFASMGIKTVKRQIINTSSSTQYQVDPPRLEINASPEGGFMFGVSLFGFDLTAPGKMFDIKLYQEYYTPIFNLLNRTEVPLVPCSQSHFNFNTKLLQSYRSLNMSKSLCPPLNYTFLTSGKVTSDIFSQIRLTVQRCNSTIDPYCANDTQFATIQAMVQQFALVVPVVNTFINAGQQQYKDYFLEDQNYFAFSSLLGATGLLSIEEETIETDVSIMPYQQIVVQKIIRVPDSIKTTYVTPLAGRPLAEVRFMRSASTITHSRSFNKVDTYFSYVGGLIGTIIGLIFIMNKYNETAYEISLAHNTFKYNEQKQVQSNNFNFGYYLLILVKKMLNFLNCSVQWLQTQSFIDVCEEINSQLDITFLMRKMAFYDAVFQKMFEKYQLEAICMREKPVLQKVRSIRKMHFAKEIYGKKEEKQEEKAKKIKKQLFQPSKQEICHDDLEGSLSKNGEKHSSFEDFSELDLSHQSDDLRRIEKSIKKVLIESKTGKDMSKKIVEDINEITLQQIMVKPEEEAKINALQFQMLEIEPENSSNLDIEKKKKKKKVKQKKEGNNFLFDFKQEDI